MQGKPELTPLKNLPDCPANECIRNVNFCVFYLVRFSYSLPTSNLFSLKVTSMTIICMATGKTAAERISCTLEKK
jgi:hypothetical protein